MGGYRALSVILGAAALLGASTAAADEFVQVGDLHSAAGARDFHVRLERAARRFCDGRYDRIDRQAEAACIAGARSEAMAQLSADQRQALADGLAAAHGLANAEHGEPGALTP